LIFLALISVATIIVITHLKQGERITTWAHWLHRKRKRQPTPDADDELDDFIVPDDNGMERDDSDNEDFSNELRRLDTQEPEPDNDDWTFSLDATHVNKKTRRSGGKSKSTCEPLDKTAWDDGEIISLSSD